MKSSMVLRRAHGSLSPCHGPISSQEEDMFLVASFSIFSSSLAKSGLTCQSSTRLAEASNPALSG